MKITENFLLDKPLFLISVPKCGTVLLLNIFNKILGWQNRGTWLKDHALNSRNEFENKLYNGHLVYSKDGAKKISKFKKILLIRDPRDYVVSYAKFFNSDARPATNLDRFFAENKFDYQQIMLDIIRGLRVNGDVLNSLSFMYQKMYFDWLSKNSYTVRYEDLVETDKNGKFIKRYEIIQNLLEWLDLEPPNNFQTLVDQGDESSKQIKLSSFREGKRGNWKIHFKEYHKLFFKEYNPDLLQRLRYEQDNDW